MDFSDAQRNVAMWAIFAVTYIGIAMGGFPRLVLDRTGVAMLGAIAMLVVRGVGIRQAAGHMDYETLLLLFGLMIFSAQLRVAGFYIWSGQFLTRLIDRPFRLLAGIIAVSAALSALLANDIVCLAFTPLLCSVLLAARRDPIPHLLALAMASNIGSAATLIGNPQNMYISSVAELPFGHFSLVMIPAALVGLALCWVTIALMFRQRLQTITDALPHRPAAEVHRHENETLVPSSLPLQTEVPQRDMYLIGKSLVLLAGLVLFFLLVRGANAAEARATAALAGAGVLLCSRRAKAARLYQLVDWNLLLLFMGLFVVNGAMQEQKLTASAVAALADRGWNLQHIPTLAAVTASLSNLVSNVPAVLLLQPFLDTQDHQQWYLLALVSTWAGNLTLVGSIANLIVAESAGAYGVRVDLKTYCMAGVPLTILTVVLGTLWIAATM